LWGEEQKEGREVKKGVPGNRGYKDREKKADMSVEIDKSLTNSGE